MRQKKKNNNRTVAKENHTTICEPFFFSAYEVQIDVTGAVPTQIVYFTRFRT